MSLTFYFAPDSTALITAGVLAELGTPHEQIVLDIRGGGTKTPGFLAINPNGKVPTIVHEGTAIWESAAITMYLGETFGVDAKLYPAPGPLRGEAMKWITWSNVVLAQAAVELMIAMHGDEAAVEKARQGIAACLGILDGGLAGKSFLLGDYSLADTHVQGFVGWLGMMKVDLSPFANVSAWLQRCMERPGLAKLMAGG